MRTSSRALFPVLLFAIAPLAFAQGVVPNDAPWDPNDPLDNPDYCDVYGGPITHTIIFGSTQRWIHIGCAPAYYNPQNVNYEPSGPNFPISWPASTEPTTDGEQWLEVGQSSIPGDQCGSLECGNPIDVGTFNKHEIETDYLGPGALPLKIQRHYNSIFAEADANDGVFGQGWTANFAERITAIEWPDPQDNPTIFKVVIENETGQRFELTSTDGSPWVTTENIEMNFSYNEDHEIFSWIDDGLVKLFLKSGDLESITHPNGEFLTFVYDALASPGEVETITHSSGAQLEFTYDAYGRVKEILDPADRKFEYFYNVAGNLTHVHLPTEVGTADSKIIYHYEDSTLPSALTGISYTTKGNPVGTRFSTYTYEGNGYAISSEHAGGVDRIDVTPQSLPNVVRHVSRPLGGSDSYTFQEIAGRPRLTYTIRLDDPTVQSGITYDANGRYDQITDFEGYITDYDYDEFGRPEKVTTGYGTPEARSVEYDWDQIWGAQTRIETDLLKTEVELDSAGLPTKITMTNKSAYGVAGQQRIWDITTTRYTDSSIIQQQVIDGPRTDVTDITTLDYNTAGLLTTVTQRVTPTQSLVTTYSNYDAYGRAQKVTYPSGLIRDFKYRPNGDILEIKDTVGSDIRITEFDYNVAGDLGEISYPDGTTETYTYDSARRLVSVIHDDGDSDPDDIKDHRLIYDNASNLTSEQIWKKKRTLVYAPGCNPFAPPFPECGGEMQWIDKQTYDIDYEYDTLNRLTKVVQVGISHTFEHDDNGNVTLHRDAMSKDTTFAYDANNDRISTTHRDGGVSEVTYDAQGNIKGVKDALGQWTYYDRDGFGQVIQLTSPATGTTTYAYDAAGNLTNKTDARGVVLNYEYDALNRLEYVRDGSLAQLQSFEYDANSGFLDQVVDDAGTHTFSYDAAGDLLSRSSSIGAATLNLTYSYDTHGRLESITYPSGLVVTYGYDSFGEIDTVTAAGAGLSQTNVATTIQYYPLGPIEEFTFGNGEQRSYTRNFKYKLWRLNSGTHMTRTFTFDYNYNITAYDNRTFAYDDMERLTDHTGPDGTWEYGYDLNGNRNWHKENAVQTTYNYNTAKTRLNTLSGGTTQSRSYDLNGNTIDIDGRDFDHNDLSRFWRYRDGSLTVEYKHDAFGARMVKDDGSTKTLFAYDGSSLLHEDNGATPRDYIYLHGEPIGLVQSGTLYYIHSDHLARPEVVTDGAKVVKWQRQNNAWSDVPTTDLIGGLNLGFPGQYYDNESGTYYNYFRTYDGETGRYLQSDPIGLAGDLNTYAYVGNNPVSRIDPFGLTTIPMEIPAPIYKGAEVATQACVNIGKGTLAVLGSVANVAIGVMIPNSTAHDDTIYDENGVLRPQYEGMGLPPVLEAPPGLGTVLNEEDSGKPPSGSKPIDQTDWSGDHQGIKKGVGAGPRDKVVISPGPDNDVWVQNPDGSWTNHGPAGDYTGSGKPSGRRGKDRR